ncbi:MAG TPA: hypothetical protein VJT67_01580 [Longimicrobiaceae bacterium]|nr:hypothetical protein [Longimicrobiaceae bacterium]
MGRKLMIGIAAITVLASMANPHFLAGGAYDVYGETPWWQWSGAGLCLVALAVAAVVLWRRSARWGLSLLACELLLYLAITAGSISSAGMGYFSNGWGRSFLPSFYVAVALRVLLLCLAGREVALDNPRSFTRLGAKPR